MKFNFKKWFYPIIFVCTFGGSVLLGSLPSYAFGREIYDDLFNDFIENTFDIPSWGWKLMDISLTHANDVDSLVKVPLQKEKDYDKINNTIDKLVKFFRLYEYPDGSATPGSHGGGGNYREPSHLVIYEDPIVLNTEPKVTVDPIIKNTYNTTNNDYEYSVYNPVTFNYEVIENTYYNYDYDITIFQTDNYYIYYNYDITNYFITVAPISDYTEALYYVQYYELPDGRNSYNLTPNDIKGVIFNYDVLNYDITPITDDIEVLGLFHLDGNTFNSSAPTRPLVPVQYGRFVDGYFNGGVQLSEVGESFYLNFEHTNNRYIYCSFWLYSPNVLSSLNNAININYLNNSYRFNYDIFFSGGWHYIQVLVDTLTNTKQVSVDGGDFGAYNDSNLLISSFFRINSSGVTFQPLPPFTNSQPMNVNGVDAYPLVMYQSIIDEVLIYTWKDNVSFPFDLSEIRYQPYDLPFAYTVPNNASYSYHFESIYYPYTPNFRLNNDGTQVGFYKGNYEYLYTNTEIIADSSQPLGYYRRFYFEVYCNPWSDLLYLEFMNAYLGGNDWYYFDEGRGEYLRRDYGDDAIFKIIYTFNLFYDSDGLPDGFQIRSDIYLSDEFNNLTFIYYIEPSIIHFTEAGSFEMYIYMEDYEFYELKTSINIKNQCIAVQSPYPLNRTQIGGVRSFVPYDGDCFISLFENRATSCQVYYDGVWHECGASIFYKGLWYDVKYYDFSNLMLVNDDSNQNGGTTIINYYGSLSDNINIIGNGNVSIDVDTTNFDKQSFTDVLTSIPKIFITLGSTLLGMLTFLPTWLTVFIGTIFSCFVSLLIYLLVRRS